MKKFCLLGLFLGFSACANSAKKSNETPKPAENKRAEGYGDFLYLAPGSIVIKNWVDKDDDGVDDRYQLQPGGKALPLGSLYQKK